MALGSQVTVAQLMVLLRANTAQYDRAMTTAMGTTQKFAGMTAQAATQMGRAWSYGVTLPLVIAGAAAVKTSLDFDRSMTKIAALVDLPREAMAALESEIETLSSTTAQTQNELAEASYFIASSGYKNFAKGGDGLEILEMSAKGAATQLGEVAEVADLVTSVMNAYGSENIDAAQTMDILTAAIREGKAEPDAFAQAIGRGLAQAQAAGVEFHELAAAISSLSLSGISAQRATTAFIAILRDLQKPSAAGREALDKLHMSVDDVREGISIDFLGTLKKLRKEFGEDNSALRDLFKNTVAYNAVLDLTGEKLEETTKVFKKVRDSVGDFDKAFGITLQSDAHKAQQAITDMHTALKEFGDALWPFVAMAGKFLATLAAGFSALPEPLQKFIAFLTIAAALFGPFLLLWVKYRVAVGRVTTALLPYQMAAGRAGTSTSLLAAAATKATGGLTALRVAATLAKVALSVGLLLALDVIIGKFMEARQRVDDLAASLSGAIEGGADDLGKQIRIIQRDLDSLAGVSTKEKMFGNFGFFGTGEYKRAVERIDALTDVTAKLTTAAETQEGSQKAATMAVAEYTARAAELYDLRNKDQGLISGLSVSTEDLTDAEKAANEAREQAIALVLEYAGAAGTSQEEIEKLTGSLGGLTEEQKEAAEGTKMMTGHISAFLGHNRDEWAEWLAGIKGAVGSFAGVLSDVIGNLKLTGDKIADQFEEQFEHMDEFVRLMREAADKMPTSLFTQLLEQGAADPKGAVHFLEHYLNEEGTRNRINTSINSLDKLKSYMGETVVTIDKYGMQTFNSIGESARRNTRLAKGKLEELMARRAALIGLMKEEGGANSGLVRKIDEEIEVQRDRIRRLEGVKDGVGDLTRALEGNKQAADPAAEAMDGWAVAVAAGVEEAARLNEKMRPLLTMLGELQGVSNISFKFSGPEGAPSAAGVFGGSAAMMANSAIAAVPGPQVISSLYRPLDAGSFHSDPVNPAADIAGSNLPGVFSFLMSHFGNSVRELIYGHTIVEKGRVGFYAPSDHFDHVHLADKGGMFKGPGIVRIGNIDEAVFKPARKIGSGGGGDTYNLTVNAGDMADERKLLNKVEQVIREIHGEGVRVNKFRKGQKVG